jgi:imidazolonepropionase-like amidohydrolase
MRRQWLGIFLVLGFLVGTAASGQSQTLVLQGGTLIDGTGKNPISDAVIVIEGSRIKAVGTKGRVSFPQNAQVINTEGKTILPGLIDSHIHLRDHMLPMFLRYGVTTVGDTNNYTDWTIAQREALKSGRIKGPRLFVSGTAAAGDTPEAGPPSQRKPFGAYVHTSSDGSASPSVALQTVEESRAYARSLLAKHVDMLKVDLDLTLDQLRAIIDEAKKAGVPVVGHSQNIRKAAEVGLKYMEHTDTLGRAILEQMGGAAKLKEGGANPERLMDTKLFDPLVQFMVKQGVYVNPTLFARWRTSTPRGQEWANAAAELIKDPGLAFVPAAVRTPWTRLPGRGADNEGYMKTAEFLRKYAAAGGKIVAGTDAGFMPGLTLHYEMQMLADLGMPTMKVIQSATLWGAESIGQQKDLGSVEPGKLADIAVIEGNPLTDIAATKNIRMVIKDGKVLDTAYDPKFVNPIPRPRDGY